MPEKFEINRDWPVLNRPNALNFETNRLHTYEDWSDRAQTYPISPITLAKEGFFATGKGDEVECYSCKQRHSGWRHGQAPGQIHKQISPNCYMVDANADQCDSSVDTLPNIPIPLRNPLLRIATDSSKAFERIVRKVGIQESGAGQNDVDVHHVHPMPTARVPGVHLRIPPVFGVPRNAVAAAELIPRGPDGSLPFTAQVEDQGPQEQPLYERFSSALQRQRSFSRFPLTHVPLIQELIRHGFFFVGTD